MGLSLACGGVAAPPGTGSSHDASVTSSRLMPGVHMATTQGQRPSQQDAAGASAFEVRGVRYAVVVVCDGNGDFGGDIARACVLEMPDLLRRALEAACSVEEAMVAAFEGFNTTAQIAVPESSTDDDDTLPLKVDTEWTKPMGCSGTTAVVVLLRSDDRTMHVAHVGDSWAAMLPRVGDVVIATQDHTLHREDEIARVEQATVDNGALSSDGKRVWVGRAFGLNYTRSLGNRVFSPAVIAVPDVMSLRADDLAHVVVATDGVVQWQRDQLARKMAYARTKAPLKTGTVMSRVLVKSARDDNATAVVIDVAAWLTELETASSGGH